MRLEPDLLEKIAKFEKIAFEEFIERHPDMKELYEQYKKIDEQAKFGCQFTKGYRAAINDLYIMRKWKEDGLV